MGHLLVIDDRLAEVIRCGGWAGAWVKRSVTPDGCGWVPAGELGHYAQNARVVEDRPHLGCTWSYVGLPPEEPWRLELWLDGEYDGPLAPDLDSNTLWWIGQLVNGSSDA
jgi:hypothetical protein